MCIYMFESVSHYQRIYYLLQKTDMTKLAFSWYGILFLFHTDYKGKCALEKSMKYLQQQTCIKFIEIKPPYEVDSHYVHFISTTKNRWLCACLFELHLCGITCFSHIIVWKSCTVCSYKEWVVSWLVYFFSDQSHPPCTCNHFNLRYIQTCELIILYTCTSACNFKFVFEHYWNLHHYTKLLALLKTLPSIIDLIFVNLTLQMNKWFLNISTSAQPKQLITYQ